MEKSKCPVFFNYSTNYIKLLFLIIIFHFSLNSNSQIDKVLGNLTSADTADLSILNIFPDSFPNISIIFKAETRLGEPVWNLSKEKMNVRENSQDCEVISLEQISKNKPINLGIVIDHSGSMLIDYSQLFDQNGNPKISYEDFLYGNFPADYKPPIQFAKEAVMDFVQSFDAKKDYVSIFGFSDVVDINQPLTQDTKKISSAVDSMQADFATALYDGMIAGIEEIKTGNGIKVLVVLTDGRDNASKSKWDDVIKRANQEDIPLYIIGLGDVNQDTLKMISKATKGQFYFTQSSSSLNTVYSTISKKVQAFYNLVYSSPNFSSTDSTRQIELSFEIDSIFLVTNPATLNLPTEVIDSLKEREKFKEYIVFGGIATAALIATGVILIAKRKKRKNLPTILKLYPNPSSGLFSLEYTNGQGSLEILNLSGQVVKSIPISGNESEFDINDFEDGNYIAYIQNNGQKSNSVQFILKR